MRRETRTKTARDLQQKAAKTTERLLDLASRRLGANLKRPDIRFDLRGKTAGQVRTGGGRACIVRYNADLLERHPEQFLAQTVPHETAHVVTYELFGPRIKPHGAEWQAIMGLFGASPERCHSYDVEGLQARRLQRYQYRCGCRSHQLTSIRHNRACSGQVYLCRQCGRPLARVSDPSPE
jgi:SprT protein